MAWKAKLSPQDLDDVLKKLQINDTKMSSFTQFSNMEAKNEQQKAGVVQETPSTETPGAICVSNPVNVATEKSLSDVVKIELTSSEISQNVADISNNASDMDSTFIADSSANTSAT
jgi:hypothetical protein